MNEREVLQTVLENIQTKLSPHVFEAYFSDVQILSISEGKVTLACKNAYTRQILESRYFTTLINTFKIVLEEEKLELSIAVRSIKEISSNHISSLFSLPQKPLAELAPLPVNSQSNLGITTGLNPRYTFDTFIVGTGNQLAHAAAVAIAANPGNIYNPFFIYGNVGLGKTHLMQAIGNEVLKNNPKAKVLYCATETFLNEMIASIRTQKSNQFKEKYRSVDLLILDDIQFISNKVATQEEFFNTFNTLYQGGKQIIIASDRPPADIEHLEDRIRSRFEGGLVADIRNLNIETRIAILQRKLIDRNEFLPDTLITIIAESIDSNIRELEGALLRVLLQYKTQPNLSPSEIRSVLGNKIIARRKKINPLDIMRIVCEYLDIEMKEVKSAKRDYDIAYARQICMFLLKDILKLPLLKIAKHVGRKDHTTIMHGIEKIEKMIEQNSETSRLIAELRTKAQA